MKLEDLPEPYNLGFNTFGLWNISRHPNYFAEQMIWVSFYIFTIPYDADSIVFDFQSEYAILSIIISDKEKYVWKFISRGKPGLYEIKKDILLEQAKKENSIKGIELQLCISAEKTDSIFSTVFALKIHLSKNDIINIHDVNSDQQTLCNLTEFNGKNKNFRCLFVVRYNHNNTLDNLYIYPLFEDLSIEYSIYADFIDEIIYDSNDLEQLKNLIPNKNSEFTTDDKREDILMIDFTNDRNKYVYVSVEADKPGIVKLLTTYSTYDYTTNPNPSTPQLYVLKDKELIFEFNEKDSLMLNFVGLFGNAKIYWKDEENITYHLGRNERLSLTSSNIKQKQNDNSKNIIIIENLNEKGFIFYITYYLRSSKINFDQLFFDNSFNLNYRETNFPITLYMKLDNISKHTNVFVNINELEGEKVEKNEEDELQVFGWIIQDKSISNFKLKEELSPEKEKAIKGIYDPAKRVCLLNLKKENLTEIDMANLVVQISKIKKSKSEYNRISLTGSILQEESLIPITEKVYHHGKLIKGKEKMVYKIKIDKDQPTTVIIFSTNSDKLDFFVSKDFEGKKKLYSKTINSNGRIISYTTTEILLYRYIYLTIYQKEGNAVIDEHLTNYAFKYINIYNESSLYLYNTSMKVNNTYDNEIYKLSIKCVECDECKVEYFFKFINRENLIKGESLNNIAVIESKGIVKKYDGECQNGEIVLKIDEKDVKFDIDIQIIAHINYKAINEFISYESIFIEKKKDYSKIWTIIIIIAVCVVCLCIIILLVIILIKYSKKNANLQKRIEQTSFKEDMHSEKDEDQVATNLLLDE